MSFFKFNSNFFVKPGQVQGRRAFHFSNQPDLGKTFFANTIAYEVESALQ